MRIRLITAYPLKSLKCWYSIYPLSDSMTIQHLIKQIIETFSLEIELCQLDLELDGFHLPLKESVSKILREGDLIILKQVDDVFDINNSFNPNLKNRLLVEKGFFEEENTRKRERDEAESNIYLLNHNKRICTTDSIAKQSYDKIKKRIGNSHTKQKTICLENETKPIVQQNNLIHFSASKNKVNLATSKKIQVSKKASLIKSSSSSISESSTSESSESSTSKSSTSKSSKSSTSKSSTSQSSKSSTPESSKSFTSKSVVSEDNLSNSEIPIKLASKTNQVPLFSKNQQRPPPGQGSASTRARNMRKKKAKKLLKLKQEGVLPQSATFSDLLQIKNNTIKTSNANDIEIKPLRKYIKNKSKGFISKIGNSQSKHIRFSENDKFFLNDKTYSENWQNRCIVKEIECELQNIPVHHISIIPNNKNKEHLNKSSLSDDMPLLPDNIETLALLTEPPPVGSIIAFKHLSMNNSYEPILSDYKTATVLDCSTSNFITLQLAKRDQKQKKVDPETGEYIYGKFGVDTDIEQDGQLVLPWDNIVSPVLLQKLQSPVSQKMSP